MEVKKTTKADLTKKSTFFFSIGLAISMSLTLVAFEWKKYDGNILDLAGANVDQFDEILDIPITDLPPPPPPKIEQPQIVEIPDDEVIEEEIQVKFDVEVTEETKIEEITIVTEDPKEESDEILLIVEEEATPQGGLNAFYSYIQSNLKYPIQARRMGIEGRVFISFVVEKNGSITDVKILKGIGAGCDEEAVRIIANSPSWTPARQRGKAVRQRMTFPLNFTLS